MNNMFLEGPIQTGKSTLIRKVLKQHFGLCLDGVSGFTSQRLTDSAGHLLGFRLAPAAADLSIVADPAETDGVFKYFTPADAIVNMDVFETVGVKYIDDAIADAKAGRAQLVLLDEIGGHELTCDSFRSKLYELLESDVPCTGVVKSADNTQRMDPTLLTLNKELHSKLTVVAEFGEFESALRLFLNQSIL